MDVMEAKRGAVQRVLARQKPRKDEPVRVGGGETTTQTAGWPGQFSDPGDLGAWLDDGLARTPFRNGDPVSEAVLSIATAARAGEREVRAAVRETARLTEYDQSQVYSWVGSWAMREIPRSGAQVMDAVTDEWVRRHLTTEAPEPAVAAPVRIVNQADLDASKARLRETRGW